MDSIFEEELQINSLVLVLSTGDGDLKYPIVSLTLSASVGNLPDCTVVIMQGIDVLTGNSAPAAQAPLGAEAKVVINISSGNGAGKDRVLMGGKLGAASTGLTVMPSSIQAQYTYTIQTGAAFTDSIALGNMYFVSQADGNVDTAVKSAFNMSEGMLWSRLADDGETLPKAEMNLAEATAKMMDFIGSDGRSVAPAVKLMDVIDTSTCPSMSVAFPDTHPLSRILETQILQLINSNLFYTTFLSIIRNFYLEVVPNFHAEDGTFDYDPGAKMKVIPLMAWLKTPVLELKPADIIASNYSVQGKGRNEVDGVAVKYTRAATGLDPGGSEDLQSTAVFAEGVGEPSGPRLITDYEELRNGAELPARRLITMPLPFFVAYGMRNVLKSATTARNTKPSDGSEPMTPTVTSDVEEEEDWAKRWAEIIAQMTFAQLNRANQVLSVTIPFSKWLEIREELGQVIAAQVPGKFGSDGMVNVKPENNNYLFGLFQSWRLSITLGWDKLSIVTSISMSSVRSKEDNDVLGIEENILYG